MNIKKNSAQALIIVMFVLFIFTIITVTVASMTARELEMREVDEMSLQSTYGAEAGWERAMYYLKTNPSLGTKITIKEKCQGSPCNKDCSDSTKCNANDCNCDLNPLQNDYFYNVTITPNGLLRPNGERCSFAYCIDSSAFSPPGS